MCFCGFLVLLLLLTNTIITALFTESCNYSVSQNVPYSECKLLVSEHMRIIIWIWMQGFTCKCFVHLLV